MAIGSGLARQVGFKVETTAGTPVTVNAFLPLLEDKLMTDRARIESGATRAGRRILDSSDWAGGNIDPKGDLGFELYNVGIGPLLTGMLGTVTSTTGPVSSVYTHTWGSPGEPKPLTIQKGVPAVGGTVHPFTYAGSMISEWALEASVSEFVRHGITVASMKEIGYRTVADGVTTNGSAAITSATASFTADDVGKPISGTNIPASTTILSVQSSTAATLSANATGSGTSITFTIGIALASASYPSGLVPFVYHEGSVSVAGSSVFCKKFSMKGNNGLAADRYGLGSRERRQPIEAAKHEITGSLDLEWESRTQYDRYVRESEVALVFALTHASTGHSITVTTNVRLDGETPQAGDEGIVPQSVPFKVVGTTDALAFSLVWLTSDATP